MLKGRNGAEAALDLNGRPLVHLPIKVLLPGTQTLAPLYTDYTGNTAAPNPTFTDDRGNYTFYTDPGTYDLVAVIGGVDQAPVTATVDLELDEYTYTIPGPLSTQVGTMRDYTDEAEQIVAYRASVGTPPSTGALNAALDKNGTPVLTVVINQNQSTTGLVVISPTITFNPEDYKTLDVVASNGAADLLIKFYTLPVS